MADVKISQLPAATTPLTGAELVPVVQGGVNKQTTTSDVLAVPATLLTASSAVATDASKKFVSVTNTGTGNNVLATSPTLVTPALGTPSSGVVTNLTGTASININGTVGATTPNTGTFTTIDVSGNAVIGGTLKLAAGTVALPSLYWSTDTTTGFYRIGANINGYAVSGVNLLEFLSTGLNVTGSLSSTSISSTTNGVFSANFGLGGTGTNNALVRIDGSSASSYGAQLHFKRNGVTTAQVGQESGINGGTSDDLALYVGAGVNTNIYGGGVKTVVVSSAGAAVTGALSSTGAITTLGGASFHTTSTALTNGAGAAAGTLLNAPATGNPTKWIGINDNGTTRYIPAW